MPSARNLVHLLLALLALASSSSSSPLPPYVRRSFVPLGNVPSSTTSAAAKTCPTKAAKSSGGNAVAAASRSSSLSDAFVTLGSSSAAGAAATGGGGSSGKGGSSSKGSGSSKSGSGNTQTITKVTTTKQVIKLSNGDVEEQDCVIKITKEVQEVADEWVHQGASVCNGQAKDSNVVKSDSDGVLMCFRAGYVDESKSEFGGELTVYNVGSSKDLSQAQVEMTFADGSTLATPAGVLKASTSNLTDVGTANGAAFTQFGSFHFNHALISGASASNLAALAPTSVNMAVASGNVTTLGLIDISDAAGLPPQKQFATAKWGLFEQTLKDVSISRRDHHHHHDGNSDKSSHHSNHNSNSKSGNSNNKGGNSNSKVVQIVEDKQCKTTIISSSSNSGGFTISSGIVIPDSFTTISSGIVVTVTDSSSSSKSTGSSKGKGSNSNSNGKGSSSDSSPSSDSTTTTTSSAASSSETGGSNADAGINASIEGFGTSVGADEVSSILASASAASANGANVVGATLTSGAPTASNTAANGAVNAQGVPNASQEADTAPSASSTPFQLPGRQLQVLPIGLGVFAGVSVITLVIVGVVTYERRKYRRMFRERRMQEQVSAAAGFGTFDGRMREANV